MSAADADAALRLNAHHCGVPLTRTAPVLSATGRDALEIPLTRADCLSLGVALINFARAGERLRATPPAGHA